MPDLQPITYDIKTAPGSVTVVLHHPVGITFTCKVETASTAPSIEEIEWAVAAANGEFEKRLGIARQMISSAYVE